MSAGEDFYEMLGVSRDATEEEIERAYREKATEYHPDVSDDPDAEEKFKEIRKAKEVLTDEDAREAYDRMGHERFKQAEKRGFDASEGGAGGRAGAGAGGPGGAAGDPFGGMGGENPFQDIFDQFFGGGRSRGRGRSRSGPQAGQDLQTRLSIGLDDAYRGTEQRMTVSRPERCSDCGGRGHPPEAETRTCPDCDGRGQQTRVQQTPLGRVQQTQTCRRCEGEGTVYSETCTACGGDGEVTESTTLTVEVPAGIHDGQTLRMEGEGAPGDRRAPDGDLLIEIDVGDHPEFDREDDDLHYDLAISFPQAAFGDEVEVPTLDGSVSMDVPAGTQSGETFRLDGQGMPRLRGRGYGDLYVRTQVVVPDAMNDEQREALQRFAEAGGEEVEINEGFFERIRNSL